VAELEQVPTSDCCSTEAQATCCEPADKEACCGESAGGESCGCSAGASSDDADEIREAVRARDAAAAISVAEGGSCCDSNAAVLTDEDAAVFGAGVYGETGDELPDTVTMAPLGCGIRPT
jgi:arsenite methyltransferase